MEGGQQEESENQDPSCVLIQAGTLNQYQAAKRGMLEIARGQGHKYQASLVCQIEHSRSAEGLWLLTYLNEEE